MNLKEKFALVFTKEPFKSFRKAGITNGEIVGNIYENPELLTN